MLLGILCGVAAWAFIRLLVIMEDGFPKLPGNEYTQNILGMAVIGLMMVVLTRAFGHSYVDGVGYSVIQAILDQKLTAAGLLALLFLLKMVATTVSLGCGASGGIFSPSLYPGGYARSGLCRCCWIRSCPMRALRFRQPRSSGWRRWSVRDRAA